MPEMTTLIRRELDMALRGADGRRSRFSEVGSMSVGSDELIGEIARLLPPRWILNSISVTEADDYSVLLCPRGPVPVQDLGRVYGRGETVQDALEDALRGLKTHLQNRHQ